MTRNEIIEKTITILSIIVFFFFYTMQYYNTTLLAIALMIIELYTIIKYRKNPILFFLFVCMFYFDYSVVISKYLMSTPDLAGVYGQIKYQDTLYIGLLCVYLFHSIILLCLKKRNSLVSDKDNRISSDMGKKKTNYLAIISLTLLITIILFDYLFFNLLSLSRTLYEYLIILFILAFYYAKDNKNFRRILFILMMISTAINMVKGGRIVSLQPMIAYFFINYFDKITSKKILLIIISGVIVFTIMGLYGDYIDNGYNLNNLNWTTIVDTFSNRKLALDTSISAYWTGLTFVETSNIIPNAERIQNFIEFMTTYTIGGAKTNYMQLIDISKQYYTHYEGGYITSYFYYWLGWIGVLGISIFIGNKIKKINEANSSVSEFKKIYFIYFISTMPRWYLYFPTPLIRGAIILYVVYSVINLITHKRKKENREVHNFED